METQFRSSFAKDVRKIKDKILLGRVQGVIEAVEQAARRLATAFGDTPFQMRCPASHEG